ncbi:MAG: hypothetical protein QXQ29_02780 [Candidatus Bathyarchaeia archaeon]
MPQILIKTLQRDGKAGVPGDNRGFHEADGIELELTIGLLQ